MNNGKYIVRITTDGTYVETPKGRPIYCYQHLADELNRLNDMNEWTEATGRPYPREDTERKPTLREVLRELAGIVGEIAVFVNLLADEVGCGRLHIDEDRIERVREL